MVLEWIKDNPAEFFFSALMVYIFIMTILMYLDN